MPERSEKWGTPKDVPDVEIVFPAHVVGKLLPTWEEVPEKYKKHSPMNIADYVFFYGLPGETEIEEREGIDAQKAFRQIRACLGSFEPKHEEKSAGVWWLFELFFRRITLPDGKVFDFGELE